MIGCLGLSYKCRPLACFVMSIYTKSKVNESGPGVYFIFFFGGGGGGRGVDSAIDMN